MAQGGAIRAGEAFVELFADDSKLARGLKSAAGKLKSWGGAVSGLGLKLSAVGGLVTAPLIAAAKAAADSGARLWDMSRRTGIAVETLSLLDYAADQTGTSLETVEASVRRMQKSLAGVADETEGTTGKLDFLGITAAKLEGLNVEEQFGLVAGAIRNIQDPTQRAAAAMKVFGRAGPELLPLIDNFEQLRKEAGDFGLIKSTESAKQAKEFSEAMTLAGKVVKSVWGAIGSAVMPILKEKAERIAKLAVLVRDWIKQNKGLVVSVFQIGMAVTVGGVALMALGKAIAGLGAVLGIAAKGLSLVGAVLGFILTPVGAVVAAVAGLGAYLLYSSGEGAKALGWLGEKFGTLRQEATDSWQGIADALAAGDLGLAAQVAWTTLKMWWTKGVSWIQSIWQDAMLWLKDTFAQSWGGLRSIFSTVAHGLKIAWIETTAFLSDTWTSFVNGVLTAWNWVGNQLTKAWNGIKGLFDDSFDAKSANAAADQAYQAKKAQLDQETADRKKAIEDGRSAERAQESKDYEDSLRNIAEETQARRQALQKEHDDKIKAAEDELTKAKAEWQQSLDSARDKRKAKESGQSQGPDALLSKLQGAPGLGELSAKVSSRGTFNAATMLSLAGGDSAERTAKATAETAKNTKRLLEEARRGGLTFA